MAARTFKDSTLLSRPRTGDWTYPVADGIQIYGGSLVAIDAAGLAAPWDDTAGFTFAGLAQEDALGDAAASKLPVVRVHDGGSTFEKLPIATLTQADKHALVYCPTDNIGEDLTLVATTNVAAIGIVTGFESAGVGSVRLFTPIEFLGQA